MELQPHPKKVGKAVVLVENQADHQVIAATGWMRWIKEACIDSFKPRELPFQTVLDDDIVWRLGKIAGQQQLISEVNLKSNEDVVPPEEYPQIQEAVFRYFANDRGLPISNNQALEQ
jgi:hypothetical protein